jgi:hypothetical protein
VIVMFGGVVGIMVIVQPAVTVPAEVCVVEGFTVVRPISEWACSSPV